MKHVKLFEEFINEAKINHPGVEKAATDLAYSMPNHTIPDEDGKYTEEQIEKAMKKYSPVLVQAARQGMKNDIIARVQEILNESTLNEGFKSGDKLKHKHDSKIEIELIEPTNKGWKVYQIENGKKKIAYFDKQDISGEKSLFVNEGRIALNHVYANAPVRNKVLEILKNGRVTEQDFMDAVSKAGAPDKWIRRNSHFFKVEEEDGLKYYSLSKTGQTIISAINESVDIKYWADYNTDTSGQGDKEFANKSKDFEDTFEDAVVYWNQEADGAENRIKGSEIQKIKQLAQEFFKKAGWISVNVIQAMIAQSLNESASAEDILEVYEEFGLEENLVIDPLDLTKDIFYVSINGKTYGYQAKPGGNIEDAATTFKKMLKYSAGKALAWLKKNTELTLGAGGSGPVHEGFNPSDVTKAVNLINKEIGGAPGYFFFGEEEDAAEFDKMWASKQYQKALDFLVDPQWNFMEDLKDIEKFIKDNA